MIILGHNTGESLAVQHVSQQPGRLGASVEPLRLDWEGWEIRPHPLTPETDPDWYKWKIVPFCYRAFIYKCAWRDNVTWHLPSPSGIYRLHQTEPAAVLPDERPWVTHAWDVTDGQDWGRWVDDAAVGMADFTFGDGAALFELAQARFGSGLDYLIPPGAHHDLIVIGQAFRAYYRWRAADGESESDARTKPANRYLMITASACRVDQQEGI